MTVSLKAVAIHIPEHSLDIDALSDCTGAPAEDMARILSLRRKFISNDDSVTLGLRAARKVIQNIDSETIDLLIWTGAGTKPYDVWSASSFVQHELGLRNSWTFDLFAHSAGDLVALRVAADMMAANQSLQRVLLVGGHKISQLVDPKNKRTMPLMDFSDGGSCVLLEVGGKNAITGSCSVSDGSFNNNYVIPNAHDTERHFVSQLSPTSSKDMFLKSMKNYCHVIRTATKEVGKDRKIGFVAINHMNRAMHNMILKQVGIPIERSLYLDQFGHVGGADPWLSLLIAERNKVLAPGSRVCLVAAGFGYTWTATCFEWYHNIVVDDLCPA